MTKKILYLHIGWSKTGTSAVQKQLDLQFEELKSKGILYSKVMQMNDQAHHHFALAFKGIHGYPPKYNVDTVIKLLNEEMDSNQCESLILSSELSPHYFNNPKFMNWISRFDEVKILATVRRQSELLLSLFNQLVKDPQVRFQGTFFQLAISNFPKVNYFQHLQAWARHFGDDNIKLFLYSSEIVQQVVNYFNLSFKESTEDRIVNPSLPNNLLHLMQQKTKGMNDPEQYRKVREKLLVEYKNITSKPNKMLVTKGELKVIDQHFEHPNNVAAQRFLKLEKMFDTKDYSDILVYE